MEIEFKSRKLRRCYERHKEALKEWPREIALEYIMCVNVIQEVESFADLQAIHALRVHLLKGDRKGRWSLTIHGRWRLLFTLSGEPEPCIRIEEVSKHYGD